MPEIEPIQIGRDPYNLEFCQSRECDHLKRGKCMIAKCVYNQKLIVFWEKTGEWKGEGK